MLPNGEYFTSFLGRQFHDVGVAERKATSGVSYTSGAENHWAELSFLFLYTGAVDCLILCTTVIITNPDLLTNFCSDFHVLTSKVLVFFYST